MSGHSLEAERQAILDRMQARRERYRRMLIDGTDLDEAIVVEPHALTAYPPEHSAAHAGAPVPRPAYRTVPAAGRHGPVVQALMQHPFLVALGVAALVAVGPRRIARAVTTGGTALSTLVGNQSSVDLAGRLLTMAGAYVQGRTK